MSASEQAYAMSASRPSRRPGWLLALLLLVGCGDPYDQPGTWRPVEVNRTNIDAEVVAKADTVTGHGAPGSDAVLDEAAVRRLYSGKAMPLKNESSTAGMGSQ